MNELVAIITNYGIAGLILYVFYKLVSNELRELRSELARLRSSIDKLLTVLEERLRG